uniref:Triokinase/FMN cyclase n=1 Tax=Cacopsylla melanoneura TaxID=428564 RepID=A0A8D9FGS0_9HEMI
MATVTKFILNSPTNIVTDMLQGLIVANPSMRLYPDQKVVLTHPLPQGRVRILSGGGSGHEPFAAGYVGEGMLSGAVAGNIFTSPPSGSIEAALEALCKDNSAGVLVVVANYTGDVLNFGIACERAKTQGHKVESVVVGEDIALLDTDRTSLAGRRGMCGIVLVIKIAGAMSGAGLSLEDIAEECKLVSGSMSTLGVCLSACSMPGSGPMFTLEPDQMEVGLGIHGEAGICRTRLEPASTVVQTLLDKISRSLDLKEKSSVIVLVNNLGTLTQLEMGVVQKEIGEYFDHQHISIARLYSSSFMTSLDMKGFQVCVLRLDNAKWIQWLDGDTVAPGWPRTGGGVKEEQEKRPVLSGTKSFEQIYEENKIEWNSIETPQRDLVVQCIRVAAVSVSSQEDELNRLDQTCGDGDCGSTLKRLAHGVLELLSGPHSESYTCSPVTILKFLEYSAQTRMGGTSGALYSLMFLSAASWVQRHKDSWDWGQAFIAGVEGVLRFSAARKGDRTMLDVLIECKENLEQKGKLVVSKETLTTIRNNVTRACEETKNMIPRAGRASNVDASLIHNVDAGAYGVQLWITAILDELLKRFDS